MERASRQRSALYAARVPGRPGAPWLRRRALRLDPAPPGPARRAGPIARGGALLPEVQFLRRVRLRLGLGRRLSARGPSLLSETGHRLPVYARDRASHPVRRLAAPCRVRRGVDPGLGASGPGVECIRRALVVYDGRRDREHAQVGSDATPGLSVSLAQRRLPDLRRSAGDLLRREAQEGQARAPPRGGGQRYAATGARAMRSRTWSGSPSIACTKTPSTSAAASLR